MRYNDVRDHIKTGDLLACRGNWLMSRAIRLWTGSDISHVGLALWMKFNGFEPRLCILQAMEGRGVEIVPLYKTLATEYWPNGGKMFWQPLIYLNGDDVVNHALQYWSDGYANKYQFLVGMSPTLRRIRRLLGKDFDTDPDKWHCSELITRAVIKEGYQDHEKDPALTTPGDVSAFNCFGDRVELERSSRTTFQT